MKMFYSTRLLKAAAAVYRASGEPFDVDKDDNIVQSGLTGHILNALGAARKKELLKHFGRTVTGRALLDYAAEKGVTIDADFTIISRGWHGSYDKDEKKIGLNPFSPLQETINTIAHEIRHLWQGERMQVWTHGSFDMPPQAAIALNRLIEVDANMFAHDFTQQFLEETGQSNAAFVHRYMYDPAPASRFASFAHQIAGPLNTYDRDEIIRQNKNADARDRGERFEAMVSDKDAEAIVMQAIKDIDAPWLVSTGNAEQENYFPISHSAVRDLIGTELGSPKLTDSFNAVNERYQKQAAAPVVKASMAVAAPRALAPK